MIQPSEDRTTVEFVRALRSDPARSLPTAKVSCTLRVNAEGRPRVLAAYITLLGPDDALREVAETRMFDDGLAVVDYDASGTPTGLEFLSGASPAQMPELAAHLRSAGNELLRTAANQLRIEWMVAERVFEVLSGVLNSAMLERAVADHSAATAWEREAVFAA